MLKIRVNFVVGDVDICLMGLWIVFVVFFGVICLMMLRMVLFVVLFCLKMFRSEKIVIRLGKIDSMV